MKNYQYSKIIISMVLMVFIGCDNASESEKNDNSQPILITTGNVNNGDIFINLDSGSTDTTGDNWHISIIKDTANYNMPSIVFGMANIAVYNDTSYNEISNMPADFDSMLVLDNQTFEYGGENEILSYDMDVHKVSVTNPDYIYILNFDDSIQEVFKLKFIEYQSGYTVLQYNSLSNN